MPAPERTVIALIPDGRDRQVYICRLTFVDLPDVPTQIEIGTYIPSTQTYTRGFIFDEMHLRKVMAGLRVALKTAAPDSPALTGGHRQLEA